MSNNLTAKKFQEKIEQADKLVFVDFWASWCGPCQKMNPIIEDLKQEYSNQVEFIKINIEKNKQLASSLDIMKIPTFGLFKNGEEVGKKVGTVKKEELENFIDQQLS